jgi:hypothetical protein
VLEFACVSFRVDILSSLIQRESKPQAPIQPCSTTHSPSIAIDKVQGTLWAITSLAFRTYKFTPRNFLSICNPSLSSASDKKPDDRLTSRLVCILMIT